MRRVTAFGGGAGRDGGRGAVAIVLAGLVWATAARAGERVAIEESMFKSDPATGVVEVSLPPYRFEGSVAAPAFEGLGGVEDRLNLWMREGSAAGLLGDLYDNRDRGHSKLRLEHMPQMGAIEYAADLKGRDYGVQAQFVYVGRVVIGNASTAMTSGLWRSNARLAYVNPQASRVLYQQYIHNNLYVYPEHRDHDPGHNGRPGYGDVFPANTPYVIVSQGSSGSDRAFLQAAAVTIAAFPPRVKAELVEHGLVMPAVQMILRRTYGSPRGDAYLTGASHPTVFDGAKLDASAMASIAHAMRADALPPLARFKVLEEPDPQLGRDYFDICPRVKLMDTPAAVARIHRHPGREYRFTLDASDSFDATGRPLKYHWVVLRGDAHRIKIEPDADGVRAAVTVGWHERRPVAPGSDLESNRVDIGLFVHNGVHYSPPAFLSIHALDDESRTYDDRGRVVEIDNGGRTYEIRVNDWEKLALAASDPRQPAFVGLLSEQERRALRSGAASIGAEQRWNEAVAEVKAADTAWKKGPKGGDEERAALKRRADAMAHRDAMKAAHDRAKAGAGGVDLRAVLDRAMTAALHDPALTLAQLRSGNRAVEPVRRQLLAAGVLGSDPADVALVTVSPGEGPVEKRLTAYERRQIAAANAHLLEKVLLPGLVEVASFENYIDPAIAARRGWRDVHRYDPRTGQPIGWTRYLFAGGVERYTADGDRVTELDALDRPLVARKVRYSATSGSRDRTRVEVVAELLPVQVRFAYENDADLVGRIVATEPARD